MRGEGCGAGEDAHQTNSPYSPQLSSVLADIVYCMTAVDEGLECGALHTNTDTSLHFLHASDNNRTNNNPSGPLWAALRCGCSAVLSAGLLDDWSPLGRTGPGRGRVSSQQRYYYRQMTVDDVPPDLTGGLPWAALLGPIIQTIDTLAHATEDGQRHGVEWSRWSEIQRDATRHDTPRGLTRTDWTRGPKATCCVG